MPMCGRKNLLQILIMPDYVKLNADFGKNPKVTTLHFHSLVRNMIKKNMLKIVTARIIT